MLQTAMSLPENPPPCKRCRRRPRMETLGAWTGDYHVLCEPCAIMNVRDVNSSLWGRSGPSGSCCARCGGYDPETRRCTIVHAINYDRKVKGDDVCQDWRLRE